MNDPGPRPVDLDEVAQLLAQLERDLERARAGGTGLETLRAEVEQLRHALASDAPTGQVNEGLQGVRQLLHELGDEIKSEALTGTDYVTRIGRLLGLG
jgi:hypothetical protein